MIIKRNKDFFTSKVRWIVSLLFLFVWMVFVKQIVWPSENQDPLVHPFVFPGMLTFIFMIVNFSKDEFTIDDQTFILSNYVGIFGFKLFQDNRNLPRQIRKVLVVKRQKIWKRYLAIAIPFTTKLLVYEIFVVDSKGKPIRLFSLKEQDAEPYAKIIRNLYGIEK